MAQWIVTRRSHKGKQKDTGEAQPCRVSELFQPDGYGLVTIGRLVEIRSEQSIPPGQIKPEICIRFPRTGRMVNPVQIASHDHPPKDAIDGRRYANVAVIEHGSGIEQHLEGHDGLGRGAQDRNRGKLDEHRQDHLNRMKPEAGRDVAIHVRMVHHVEAPEERHGVEHDVLQIERDIQRDDPQEPSRSRSAKPNDSESPSSAPSPEVPRRPPRP